MYHSVSVLIIESHNVLTSINSDYKLFAFITVSKKLASEFIASATCWREFNVSIGNPTMWLIASNVGKP